MKLYEFRLLIKEVISEVFDSSDDMDTMKNIHLNKELNDFSRAYIIAALWSSTDNLDPNGGNPLDKKYTINDIAQETLDKMISDCISFQQKYEELYTNGGWSDEEAGHDFWLTRNGHGSGFWDRGYGDPEKEEIGKLLTTASKKYGEYNLYLGDGAHDGLIYGG